ncbi:MAG: hypothetical protein JWM32_2551 [Verrucomicrobia bacterium]|nr:hypothetical protein [Verrucomicrobiota bacterium]
MPSGSNRATNPVKSRRKIAIVGLGAFGVLHAETALGLDEAAVVAVCDQQMIRAQQLAGQWRVPHAFASLDELLASGVADSVIIATRTDTHAALAARAMEAGLDVLLEKPAARTQEELRHLLEVCAATGRVVMVDHICLFHSLVGPLLRRVEQEGFRAAHFVRHRSRETGTKFAGESPLELLMVHDFYVAAQMAQGAEPVEFAITESRNRRGKVDMAWVLLRWADGRVATFHSNFGLPASAPGDGWDATEVFGENYHARIDTNPAPFRIGSDGVSWPITLEISKVMGRPTGMLAEAQRSFFAVLDGAPVPAGCRIEDALQIQGWTDRLRQIAQQTSEF